MAEEAIFSADADKALEAMARMFNEAEAGELNDYQRGRFEQLAIGFLGSGGEPEMRQEWLEKADRQFGLTRKRVEMVKQIAEKATRGNLSQDDQAGLARSLIVLRLFPGKLKQTVGDLIRENPGRWQDVVTAVSLSLTNPDVAKGFSPLSLPETLTRAADRTLEYFTKEANEVVGQPARLEARVRKVMRRVEEQLSSPALEVVPTPAEVAERWGKVRSLEGLMDLDGKELRRLMKDVVVVFASKPDQAWSETEASVLSFMWRRFNLEPRCMNEMKGLMSEGVGRIEELKLYLAFVFAVPDKELSDEDMKTIKSAYARVIKG